MQDEPVEAPDGTIARCKPVSVTTSTSTVGLPRESYTERAWILVMAMMVRRGVVNCLPQVRKVSPAKQDMIDSSTGVN